MFGKRPKMPPPTSLGRILRRGVLTAPTNWWASGYIFPLYMTGNSFPLPFVRLSMHNACRTLILTDLQSSCCLLVLAKYGWADKAPQYSYNMSISGARFTANSLSIRVRPSSIREYNINYWFYRRPFAALPNKQLDNQCCSVEQMSSRKFCQLLWGHRVASRCYSCGSCSASMSEIRSPWSEICARTRSVIHHSMVDKLQ